MTAEKTSPSSLQLSEELGRNDSESFCYYTDF